MMKVVMKVSKTFFSLNSDNIGGKANEIVTVLRNYSRDNPCPRAKLAEETSLTTGQVSTVVKYMRRCSEKDLDKFIPYYPISSKKGYFLPSNWEDFAPCYATLEMWIASMTRTIRPMRDKMIAAGVNWRQLIPEGDGEDYYNWLEDVPEQNKDTSWFLDK